MKSHRLIILFIFVSGLWAAMAVRGAYLQLLPNPKLEKVKNKQFQKIIKLSSRRGDIFDRKGQELAVSVLSYSLYADPSLIKDPYRVAQRLSRHFKVPFRSLYKKVRKKNRFVWIQRRLDKRDYEKIKKWKIQGLGFKEEYKRVYPIKGLASHLIGRVGKDVQGLSGIERAYEKNLSGNTQKIRLQRDARGRALVEDGWIFAKNPEGSDVHLTIDSDLQYWVEQELSNAMKKHRAEGAWAVVLNPMNSEILAMASRSEKGKRNRAIMDVYETGSVMKTFTIAGAIEYGVVEPNTKIDTENGRFKIGRQVIKEADNKHNFKELTVIEILGKSSNVGTSKIALQMKDELVHKTFVDFGFGEKTGVDIPGEAKGLFKAPPWRDHLTANISFGHGIAVTALQVANAYAAIANGGILHRPYLVKQVYDHESGETINKDTHVIGRALSEDVAKQIKIMLSTVTGRGATAFGARIDGYPVAGKTGTAQVVDLEKGGYARGKYISNFVGFVPANDPQFVIYVAVDSPREKGYYGTEVAVPIFRSIARFALQKRKTLPAYVSENSLVKSASEQAENQVSRARLVNVEEFDYPKQKLSKMPDLKGMSLRQVLRKFRGTDVELKIKGRGKVVRNFPASGKKLRKKSKVTVYLR